MWVIVTMEEPPESLLKSALHAAPLHLELIETLCLRQEVPTEIIRLLLLHPDEVVAGTTAVKVWLAEPRGVISPELMVCWRKAIVRYSGRNYSFKEVLQGDPRIAHDWLRSQVSHAASHSLLYMEDAVNAACAVLETNPRRCVLRAIRPGFLDLSFVASVVGNDLEVYEALFEEPHLEEFRLAPLAGPISESWLQKAQFAIQRGVPPKDVAAALHGFEFSFSGNLSAMWSARQTEFEPLLNHESSAIREVGERVLAMVATRLKDALAQERHEAVYGTL